MNSTILVWEIGFSPAKQIEIVMLTIKVVAGDAISAIEQAWKMCDGDGHKGMVPTACRIVAEGRT